MFQRHEMRNSQSDSSSLGAGLRRGASRSVFALLAVVAGTGCVLPTQHADADAVAVAEEPPPLQEIVVSQCAESDRADQLSLEVDRLRADLRRAEEALIEVESSLRGDHTRADVVSAIAETRILVERVARQVPWRREEFHDAESKLAEADRQVERDYPGAALFFVDRARRIAEFALLEAKFVSEQRDTYFVEGAQANLRAGPTTEDRVIRVLDKATPVFAERSENDWMRVRVISGSAGWIHKSLIRR